MKEKIYIAGKITGDDNYKEKFDKAAKELENKGYIVLSPAILPEGMLSEDYMRICFAMLDTADVIAFLPDWEQSSGAILEKMWCEYTKKPHFEYININ